MSLNDNNYPSRRKIRVSDRELAHKGQKVEFLKLVGPKQYQAIIRQFAEQRLPVERPGGYSREDIGKMSPAQYEAARAAIQRDQEKQADPKQAVHGEFEISETQLSTPGAKAAFVELFGYDRFMQALGLDGLEELTDKAYHKALNREYKPYQTNVSGGSSGTQGTLTKPNPNVAEHSESDFSWVHGKPKPDKDK